MNKRLLILCTGNSARSQMAEGLVRQMAGDRFDVFSAGTKPSHVNPFAIRAMAEIGIDISSQRSKHLNEYLNQPFDYVITVCNQAAETCPTFPGASQRVHWDFPDPAAVDGTDNEKQQAFRQVRDALATTFRKWLADN